MKTNLRYQNGSLYEHHGAWFVRYSRRISEQDGSTNLNRVSKYLGRSKDLAEILNEYRKSMGSPEAGVVFHSGDGLPICVDKVGRRVIRRALETTGLPWYGWHAFRRGLASNPSVPTSLRQV
jgi:hypothetical protein